MDKIDTMLAYNKFFIILNKCNIYCSYFQKKDIKYMIIVNLLLFNKGNKYIRMGMCKIICML